MANLYMVWVTERVGTSITEQRYLVEAYDVDGALAKVFSCRKHKKQTSDNVEAQYVGSTEVELVRHALSAVPWLLIESIPEELSGEYPRQYEVVSPHGAKAVCGGSHAEAEDDRDKEG